MPSNAAKHQQQSDPPPSAEESRLPPQYAVRTAKVHRKRWEEDLPELRARLLRMILANEQLRRDERSGCGRPPHD